MEFTLDIIMADPAGNRTAFVETPVAPEYYAPIGAALLSVPSLQAEQAGFLCPPLRGAAGRLVMSGGEFCGNASRSFGLLLGREMGRKDGDTVEIEISGCDHPLTVSLRTEGAAVRMPLPRALRSIAIPEKNSGQLTLPAVEFEGITHVIIENRKAEQKLAEHAIEAVRALGAVDAVGVMFLNDSSMVPCVWVRETGTMIWESSCGSGTLACAVVRAQKTSDDAFCLSLRQPGGVLCAELKKQGGKVLSAQLSGPVTLEPRVTVQLTI